MKTGEHHGRGPGPTSSADCRHERSHIVDSTFHGHGYGTTASRQIFCDVCRLQRWLDVEAALALSQAELGMIPDGAAREIARVARLEMLDLDHVQREIQRTAHSLVPLLHALEGACAGEAGEFIHHGATTQDIQDTGQALEIRDVLLEAERLVQELTRNLVNLARSHRDTLMVGRTHARPALPMTFGLKVSGWIDEVLRHTERIGEVRRRVVVAQLGGGVGTMAGFGEHGPELLVRFSDRLALASPSIAWHAARDRVTELVLFLSMLTATCARIADEIRTLGRPEFDELEEGWQHGKIGSSTMPHKRNPERAEQVVVLARLSKANAVVALDAMTQEHERDSRGLRLEWVAVADASHFALAALSILNDLLLGLKVKVDNMAEHALTVAESICSEAVMLSLAEQFGKQTAHRLVYDASQLAQSTGSSLLTCLTGQEEIRRRIPHDRLLSRLDPAGHLGTAGSVVDEVVGRAEQWLVGLGDVPAHGGCGTNGLETETTGDRSAA